MANQARNECFAKYRKRPRDDHQDEEFHDEQKKKLRNGVKEFRRARHMMRHARRLKALMDDGASMVAFRQDGDPAADNMDESAMVDAKDQRTLAHLQQHHLHAEFPSNCATAIKALAEECAKTEEQLQHQLDSLRAQLETKDRYRGKTLIPTVIHRIREYMEMTRKLHKRLLESDHGPEDAGKLFNQNHAARFIIGNSANQHGTTLQTTVGQEAAHFEPPGHHDGETLHKHDLVEAVGDAFGRIIKALHSILTSSDTKFRTALDVESIIRRELVPSTFITALPVKTMMDLVPKVLFEADTAGQRKHTPGQDKINRRQPNMPTATPFAASKLDFSDDAEKELINNFKSAACNFFHSIKTDCIPEWGTHSKQMKQLNEASIMSNSNGTIRYWPNGRIPYMMDEQFSKRQRRKIWKAIAEYPKHTRVRFVPRIDDEDDFVYFRLGDDEELCSSHIGFIGGKQEVVLSRNCMQHGSILHELNHVLGFEHEHSRPDRDKYIMINWDAVQEGAKGNFQQANSQPLLEYDYYSIMHYPADAFSQRDGQATIVPKDAMVDLDDLGQRWNFSEMDVEKINLIYGYPEEQQDQE